MTQPSSNENVTIAPAAAPLSQGARSNPRQPRTREWRPIAFGAAILLLVAVAGWVFVALPEQIAPTRIAETGDGLKPGTDPTQATVPAATSNAQVVAPYRAVELERARQKAQVELGNFVELQLKLEDEMNVDAWGADSYGAVKERANAADQMFLEAKYPEALAEYAAAVADLQAVVEQGRTIHDQAVAAGAEALAERDPERAEAAFAQALSIRPDSKDAQSGAERAAKLPQVLDYLREAERALLQDDLNRADDYLTRAKQLDSATPGIDKELAQVAARRAASRYQALLSEGFAAMDAGDFGTADAAFNRVLKQRPDDSVALAGLQQNAAKRTLLKINTLRTEAEQLEGEGDLAGAMAKYDAVLAIDKTLQFARDGRSRTNTQVTLLSKMRGLLEAPGVLSSDSEFTKARQLLTKAQAEQVAGSAFQTVLQKFAALLDIASLPVPLVILSDNATEVIIQRVGALGTFERHELNLRPGNYTIVGSRDGCRDVRKEIMLTRSMPPVAIRCEEPI